MDSYPVDMYKILCSRCDQIGFHPSRVGAEYQAESHQNDTGHECRVEQMDVPTSTRD